MFRGTLGLAIWAVFILAVTLSAKGDEEDLKISLSAEAKEVYLGEPLRVQVEVTNISNREVDLPTTWEAGYFRMKITHDGKRREENCFSAPISIARYNVLRLAAKESYSRTIGILRLVGHEKVAKYEFQAILESDGRAPYSDPKTGKWLHRPCWAGKITSNPLTIKVKPLKDAKDVEALKLLCPWGKNFEKGYFADIWWPSGNIYSGEDKRFETVLDKYPKSVFAKYSEFALARAYHRSTAFWKQAIQHYSNVIEKYPKFHLTDDAELGLAKVHIQRHKYYPKKGWNAKALKHLENIITKYPKSDSGPKAKRLLADLKKKAKMDAEKDSVQKEGEDKKPEEPDATKKE